MIVYRLEDDKGYGVWAAYKGDILEPHHGLYKGGRTVGSMWGCGYEDYRYACESLESLMRYFGTGFGDLLNKGFHVVKYKVRKNHIQSSPIELVFNFKKAEYLGRIVEKTDEEKWREVRMDQIRGKEFKSLFIDEYTVSPRPPQIFGEAV